MAVEYAGTYEGELTCSAVHGPSQSAIRTTAPVDNGGTGDLFSPTDLLGVSTATCMLTILAQWAAKRQFDVTGATFRAVKHMATDPRRIAKLEIYFSIPGVPEDKRAAMHAAMMLCPVKASLHPDLEVEVHYDHR